MASVRQINANRINAQKSSGPNTTEGKEHSRRNSFKHGLATSGAILDEETEKAIALATLEWRGLVNLVDKRDECVFTDLIFNYVKHVRALREESFLTAYYIERAESMWQCDHEIEAARLGAEISKDPALGVLRLQSTSHGCDWLIHRWKPLLARLEGDDIWEESHNTLMWDLAGLPYDIRYTENYIASEPGCPDTIAFIREQIAKLKKFKEDGLDYFDEHERRGAEAGFPVNVPKPLAQVKRYIAMYSRGFSKAFNILVDTGRYLGPAAATRKKTSTTTPPPPVAAIARPLPQPKAPQPEFETKREILEALASPSTPPVVLPKVCLSDSHEPPARVENRRARRAREKRQANRR